MELHEQAVELHEQAVELHERAVLYVLTYILALAVLVVITVPLS